ncbi:helix-turn-helix domain-containing protein [Pseudalkalibacillus salsuginis]|uniref:helix-turn-helix domain-containing protein n=1 Tax=Pseudalkalibacillus salsuginis TaxID=2910972 RepID=UPI001CD3B43B|nr:helix-turn-helix transcriptional regulator [Pseudalkalibacillus salsuginis]MCF6411892.1 helix-turn-helix domain-containing protein [Pseudalkalibacillus salsuginis]
MEAEQWGRRIRAFRKLKGYTQEGLAGKMNISVSILGEIERGNRKPDQAQIHKVAETLDISVEELSPEKVQHLK